MPDEDLARVELQGLEDSPVWQMLWPTNGFQMSTWQQRYASVFENDEVYAFARAYARGERFGRVDDNVAEFFRFAMCDWRDQASFVRSLQVKNYIEAFVEDQEYYHPAVELLEHLDDIASNNTDFPWVNVYDKASEFMAAPPGADAVLSLAWRHTDFGCDYDDLDTQDIVGELVKCCNICPGYDPCSKNIVDCTKLVAMLFGCSTSDNVERVMQMRPWTKDAIRGARVHIQALEVQLSEMDLDRRDYRDYANHMARVQKVLLKNCK
ncbi:hypothetical protein JKP88DRAFT_251660 [Tribonema minus]|uniref:Uncharacterized protein n=1 Tax=Tribonema minus TaxID=303371 RepID=A0A835ZFN5_9STRA|nr:hypothetical protein JKP88DRAFT_251660 [Tribonema minus]